MDNIENDHKIKTHKKNYISEGSKQELDGWLGR